MEGEELRRKGKQTRGSLEEKEAEKGWGQGMSSSF